jgi:hypothetical protein
MTPMRLTTWCLGLVLCGVALTACGGGHPTTVDAGSPLANLDHAIGKLNHERAALLADLSTLATAASAADAASEVASEGDVNTAASLIPKVDTQTSDAAPIAARSRSNVVAYQQALQALVKATEETSELTPAQRSALQAVDTAGKQEAICARASGRGYADAWPYYAKLTSAQRAWLTHAQAGWYRDADESGHAYEVSLDSFRADLDQSRVAMNDADEARVRATGVMAAALTHASAALRPLRVTDLQTFPSTPAPTAGASR